MRRFVRVVVAILATVGALVLLFIGAGAFAISRATAPALPDRMVLKLDLNGGLDEGASNGPLDRLEGTDRLSARDLTWVLDRAAGDSRIAGIVADFDGAQFGMAQAQEIRDALETFRKSGKTALAYASSMGEGGAGTIPYYAASSFGEVWLQPSGEIGLTGFMAQSPFFKGMLDLLGVRAEFGSRWEYKSAIEIFTHRQFSTEAKDSLDFLVQSWTRQVVDGIARSRGIGADQVRAMIDRAPLLAEEAKAGRLVDRLAYWDEVEKALMQGGAKIVDIDDYASSLKTEPTAAKVALILGVGEVKSRDNGNGPFESDAEFSAERVTRAFRDAVKDPSIRAILFRIDSPGGSYAASDAIWREVGNARAAGKPVIVSMGNVAASGAYFSAMAADHVVAEPGTITGSIGVFTGKLVFEDLWKKLGIDWDGVKSGQNADIWSANQSFSPSDWERVNAILDHIYGDFAGKAASNRNISPEAMDKIARGRIWPGDKAKELGLVDEIGGYGAALAAVRRLARLPAQNPIDLEVFPRPRNPLEKLQDAFKGPHPTAVLALLARLDRLTELVLPLLETAQPAGRAELRMPPVTTR